jgi:glucose/arabinose dehydrogenase
VMGGRFWIAGLALVWATSGQAQQEPPPGIAPVALPAGTVTLDTAEVHKIAVSVLATDFPRPFAMEFLPDGNLLVAERAGNLRIIPEATSAGAHMRAEPVAGMPRSDVPGNFGLIDIAVHPRFAENHLLYWTWNIPVLNADKPDERPRARLAVMRGALGPGGLTGVETIYEMSQPGSTGGSRLQVGADGMLWVTTGAPVGPVAQETGSPNGKVLRLTEDGGIPADNPFVNTPGADPAVYTLGHRDQHGLTIHPVTGQVFTAEHGPNGGDEVNLVSPGANYGWPDHSWGRNYDGTAWKNTAQADGVTDPVVVWVPSIAPSGLLFYTGDKFPAWQGNLFVGSGRWGEIDNTGSVQRVVFNDSMGELRREALLQDLHQRVRDIQQGPDGNIYVLTDGPSNAVLRITPSE